MKRRSQSSHDRSAHEEKSCDAYRVQAYWAIPSIRHEPQTPPPPTPSTLRRTTPTGTMLFLREPNAPPPGQTRGSLARPLITAIHCAYPHPRQPTDVLPLDLSAYSTTTPNHAAAIPIETGKNATASSRLFMPATSNKFARLKSRPPISRGKHMGGPYPPRDRCQKPIASFFPVLPMAEPRSRNKKDGQSRNPPIEEEEFKKAVILSRPFGGGPGAPKQRRS